MHSKTVVLVLFVICVALWLFAAEIYFFMFSCFALFIVLMVCVVGPVKQCVHLVGDGEAGFLVSQWFEACHYENTPIQIYRKFHHQKLKFFG